MKEKIVQYLKNKYFAEIIILHGSRASGKSRDNSDWDIFVFTNKDVKGNPGEFDGQKLDVNVIRLPFERDEFIDDYGRNLHNAELLLDNEDKTGKNIIEEGKKYYALGRNLTTREYANRKNYMSRIIDRMSGTVDKPERFFLYLGYFYEKALQYWFETKGRFSKPVYDAVEVIKAEDDNYYQLLETIFSNTVSNEDKLKSVKELQKFLFK